MTRPLICLAVVFAIVAFIGALCPSFAQDGVRPVAAAEPQVKDDLFAGTEKFAQGATGVTDVNLDPNMLAMIGGEKSGGLAQKMGFVIVHSYRYAKPGMYKMEDVDLYREKLRAGNWNCFIHTSDSKTGESSDVCARPAPNHQGKEMAIITVEPMELTFVHIAGNASLSELGALGTLNGQSSTNNSQQSPAPAPK